MLRDAREDLGGFEESCDPESVISGKNNSQAAAFRGLDCLDAPCFERSGRPGLRAHAERYAITTLACEFTAGRINRSQRAPGVTE